MSELTDAENAFVRAGCTWIDENADVLMEFLGDLVARPSLSGDEGMHNDETTTVGRLWSFLNKRGDSLALDTQLLPEAGDYCDDDRENIYAVLSGRGDSGFLATSHTDVVPPGPVDAWPGDDPWEMRAGTVRHVAPKTVEVAVGDRVEERSIRDKMNRVWQLRDDDVVDALFGRGVYDNKASIVCLVGSLLGLDAALSSGDISLGGDVVHGHLVDEEYYQVGAKNMVGWGAGGDWLGDRYPSYDGWSAVVLEGSYGFVPVVGHRGLVWVTLRANGESAHASTPELGRNAVLGITKALAETDTDDYHTATAEPFVDDALLGDLTISPGTTVVGGGIQRVDQETGTVERGGVNTIPDWCEATFDVRIPRWDEFPEHVEAVQDRLTATVTERASSAVSDVEFTAMIGEHEFFPPVALADDRDAAADHPLVRTAAWATESTFGYEPGIDVAPGVTDAAFVFHGTHIPTLVEYGPAGALSHESLEFVERDQVIEGAKAMLKLTVSEVGLSNK